MLYQNVKFRKYGGKKMKVPDKLIQFFDKKRHDFRWNGNFRLVVFENDRGIQGDHIYHMREFKMRLPQSFSEAVAQLAFIGDHLFEDYDVYVNEEKKKAVLVGRDE